MSDNPNVEKRSSDASEQRAPICQSCGMPLRSPSDFGTAADGSRQTEYCHFCFFDGVFTQPEATLEGMLETTIVMGAAATGRPVAEIRAALTPLLPSLKRWRDASGGRTRMGGRDG